MLEWRRGKMEQKRANPGKCITQPARVSNHSWLLHFGSSEDSPCGTISSWNPPFGSWWGALQQITRHLLNDPPLLPLTSQSLLHNLCHSCNSDFWQGTSGGRENLANSCGKCEDMVASRFQSSAYSIGYSLSCKLSQNL